MVKATCDLTDGELAAARRWARQAVAGLVAGAGASLQFQAMTSELLIVNPQKLDRGTVHVDYGSGLVGWERTVWSDLGYLPGYPIGAARLGPIGPETILRALLGARQVIMGPGGSDDVSGPLIR